MRSFVFLQSSQSVSIFDYSSFSVFENEKCVRRIAIGNGCFCLQCMPPLAACPKISCTNRIYGKFHLEFDRLSLWLLLFFLKSLAISHHWSQVPFDQVQLVARINCFIEVITSIHMTLECHSTWLYYNVQTFSLDVKTNSHLLFYQDILAFIPLKVFIVEN